jgi:hypothetical protein
MKEAAKAPDKSCFELWTANEFIRLVSAAG